MNDEPKRDSCGDDTSKPRLVSLALPTAKKKKSTIRNNNSDAFDDGTTSSAAATTGQFHDDDLPKEPLVIPAIPNKFGIHDKKSTTAKALSSAADEEALQALQAQAEEETINNESSRFKDAVIQASQDTFQRETQQFKADLETLPDALDSTEYAQRVPIADFGAAMLRGMGWKEPEQAKRSKKNATKDDDEIMPRPHRLGLGAIPKMEDMPLQPGRMRRPDQVKQRARLEEQQKEYIAERERQRALDKQRTLQNGSLVTLRNGTRAKIIQLVGVPGLNMVKVWIENDHEASIVKRGEIAGLLTRDELEHRPYHHAKELTTSKSMDISIKKDPNEDEKAQGRGKRSREDEEDSKQRNKGKPSKRPRDEESSSSRRKITWIIPNIRVRVVTEKLGRKYFKEKGIVIDVTSKGATLRFDKSGRVLDRVPEHYLETALPKPGGKAIVLAGRHKYAKGKLLERDSKAGKGVIQIFEDMSVQTLSLDDLAEFVGSLDEDIEE